MLAVLQYLIVAVLLSSVLLFQPAKVKKQPSSPTLPEYVPIPHAVQLQQPFRKENLLENDTELLNELFLVTDLYCVSKKSHTICVYIYTHTHPHFLN